MRRLTTIDFYCDLALIVVLTLVGVITFSSVVYAQKTVTPFNDFEATATETFCDSANIPENIAQCVDGQQAEDGWFGVLNEDWKAIQINATLTSADVTYRIQGRIIVGGDATDLASAALTNGQSALVELSQPLAQIRIGLITTTDAAGDEVTVTYRASRGLR